MIFTWNNPTNKTYKFRFPDSISKMSDLHNNTDAEAKKKHFEIFSRVDLMNVVAYSSMALGE